MNIYIFPHEQMDEYLEEWNEFTPSEWNDADALPSGVYDLIEYAKDNDLVFTEYNFMLCFNLQDEETYHGDNILFVPDPKFGV